MRLKKISLLFSTIILSIICTASIAEGLSKRQGDAILQELKKIRILLENTKQAGLAQGLRKPPASPVKVSTKGGVIIGKINAPLTLLEYTDYQCPYCYKFYRETYPQLKQKYIDTGKIRLIIKDLPLSAHPHARKATQAARCADDQGKFLAMHDILYKNSQRLAEQYLPQYAKQLSLDVDVFKSCLASGRHLDEIDRQSAEAQTAGINGTPTFVLGKTSKDIFTGTRIVGAKPLMEFERRISVLVSSLVALDKKAVHK